MKGKIKKLFDILHPLTQWAFIGLASWYVVLAIANFIGKPHVTYFQLAFQYLITAMWIIIAFLNSRMIDSVLKLNREILDFVGKVIEDRDNLIKKIQELFEKLEGKHVYIHKKKKGKEVN